VFKVPIRIITATSSFDGHDAGINYVKLKLLQQKDFEIIHLAHNRSVEDIVTAAIQENADAIGISSYQGGHMEYFNYMMQLLKENGSGAKIFVGGGATITTGEAEELKRKGIAGVYRTGDYDFVEDILTARQEISSDNIDTISEQAFNGNHQALGQIITWAELFYQPTLPEAIKDKIRNNIDRIKTNRHAKVVGITGSSGAGKSTVIDELVRRFVDEYEDKKVAVISVDPSKQKEGTLLGDRIRMNYISAPRVFMRSVGSRGAADGLSNAVEDMIEIFNSAGFGLIIVETLGIDQLNSRITEISDLAINIMTSEYGSPTQLDKKEIISEAQYNVVNKFDRRGSKSAFDELNNRMHIALFEKGRKQKLFGTNASRFNDSGMDTLFRNLMADLHFGKDVKYEPYYPDVRLIIPHERIQYLGSALIAVRSYRNFVAKQISIASELYALETVKSLKELPEIEELISKKKEELHPGCRMLLEHWDDIVAGYVNNERNQIVTHSGTKLHRVAVPRTKDLGEKLRFLLMENMPGEFPYTNGVYPFKSEKGQVPTRMFAGLQTPQATNERFHFLSKDYDVPRLSTAFDGLTLYGADPDISPGDYGKIGESGVSICTVDDVARLFKGFELGDGTMSVSMTINGPAPIMLAMFFNTAIDQKVQKYEAKGIKVNEQEIKKEVLQNIRGTIQADILKEDIAQNSCIFSLDFALKMMGDVQQYFIDNNVNKFNSISISGYHIAEAGANPIEQVAFTLANGLTYVEYFISRGMHIDDIGKNLSFFFSTGLDEEYSVIGRVARRIWAVVMRDVYGANEKTQKMRYHIQTSGRSLQERESDLNDIRTTLQALTAWQDSANSLHTNSFDEAYTTPTRESVYRALGIQRIIQEEFGYGKFENINSGSFAIEELSDAVENAILLEFARLNEEGGVLGAIENGYQRRKIQGSSFKYELDIRRSKRIVVGVNKYQNEAWQPSKAELIRSREEHKHTQLSNLAEFKEKHKDSAPQALESLKKVVRKGGNIFEELMNTTRYCSLGQITNALYEVGGRYRRSS